MYVYPVYKLCSKNGTGTPGSGPEGKGVGVAMWAQAEQLSIIWHLFWLPKQYSFKVEFQTSLKTTFNKEVSVSPIPRIGLEKVRLA